MIRTILCLILTSIAFFASSLWATSCEHTATSLKCTQFVNNYDGDTLTLNIPGVHPLFGKNISIRIFAIDTPERRTDNACEKDLAIEAKKVVYEKLSQAKRIDLENIQRDKYFRILADVFADGINIGDLLMAKGLAYRYYGDRKLEIDWCRYYRNAQNHGKKPAPLTSKQKDSK